MIPPLSSVSTERVAIFACFLEDWYRDTSLGTPHGNSATYCRAPYAPRPVSIATTMVFLATSAATRGGFSTNGTGRITPYFKLGEAAPKSVKV